MREPVSRVASIVGCSVALFLLLFSRSLAAQSAKVQVWEGTLTLPTTVEELPSPNPPFDLFASERFNYPYTIRDALTDQRKEVALPRAVPGERVPEGHRAAGAGRPPL